MIPIVGLMYSRIVVPIYSPSSTTLPEAVGSGNKDLSGPLEGMRGFRAQGLGLGLWVTV